MVGKNPTNEDITLLYLGTATYDLESPMVTQTNCFVKMGCKITNIQCANDTPNAMAMSDKVAEADIILVSGGNTLYAVDRWHKIGLDSLLREAMERGVVMAGGSAGAICWFDAGHSDSHDPDSYKGAMAAEEQLPGDSVMRPWRYIRCPGLGFLPGLACPHHDRTQSNGVLRADDFDEMLLRSPGEVGLAIDHWAALVVEGTEFRVFSLDGKPGSVGPDGSFCRSGAGVPGIFKKSVVNGKVCAAAVPQSGGKLIDLLEPAQHVVEDNLVDECRLANPDDTSGD
jgi:dipeptidase E